jgi:hypothetical protein
MQVGKKKPLVTQGVGCHDAQESLAVNSMSGVVLQADCTGNYTHYRWESDRVQLTSKLGAMRSPYPAV